MQNLWNIRDELHVAEDVIFVGEKVLLPAKLRQQMLRLVRESNMGERNPKPEFELSCTGQACQRTSNTKSLNVQCA